MVNPTREKIAPRASFLRKLMRTPRRSQTGKPRTGARKEHAGQRPPHPHTIQGGRGSWGEVLTQRICEDIQSHRNPEVREERVLITMGLACCQGVPDITKQALESGHTHRDTRYAASQHNNEDDPPNDPEQTANPVPQAVEEEQEIGLDAVEAHDEQDDGGPAGLEHRLCIREKREQVLQGDRAGIVDPAHEAVDLVREALREALDAGDEAQRGHHEPVLGEEVSETSPSDVDARGEGDGA